MKRSASCPAGDVAAFAVVLARRWRRRQRQTRRRWSKKRPSKASKAASSKPAIHVKSEGEKGGDVKADSRRPVPGQRQGQPAAAGDDRQGATATANGEKVDFEGGLTVLSDRAFVGLDGKNYEVDPTTFGFIKSGFERAQQEEGEEERPTSPPARKRPPASTLAEFVDNLENEGGEDVAGTSTTKVSGDLNAEGRGRRDHQADRNPGLLRPARSGRAAAAGELEKARGELTGAVKKAHVEIYVGEDDHIIRKVAAELTIEPQQAGEKVEIEFEADARRSERKTEDQGAGRRRSRSKTCSANSASTRSNCSKAGGAGGLGGLLEGITGGDLRALGGGSSAGESFGGGRRSGGECAVGEGSAAAPAGIHRMPAGGRNAD